MATNPKSALSRALVLLAILGLAALFYQRAAYNLVRVDYRNTNFFVFWLAGKLVGSGQNPYNAVQWAAGNDAYGVTWRPNRIFPYPLPLALFLAPLGLLTVRQAYFAWQIVSEVVIAIAAWSLLNKRPAARYRLLFLPLIVSLLYFGPVYLTLQIGAMGAFTMIAILGAIELWGTGNAFLAGALLSLMLLKPPQGATILILAMVWLIARRDWPAIRGLATGALALLVIGMLTDPLWVVEFAGAGQAVMDRTVGIQSNTFGFAYWACGQERTCMWIFGGAVSTLILAAAGLWLWRRNSSLGPWETFNFIIPLAFISTVYLWSYDQILYVIPIVWIAMRLLERTNSYVLPLVSMLLIVLVSLMVLFSQAQTHTDLWSILTTALVFGCCALLGFRSQYAGGHT